MTEVKQELNRLFEIFDDALNTIEIAIDNSGKAACMSRSILKYLSENKEEIVLDIIFDGITK